MRYITHSKYRNWSKCDVRRILNCDIYRIYFLNAMYVASACGVLMGFYRVQSKDQTAVVVVVVTTPHTDANSIQKDNHQLSTQFKKTKRGPAFRAK